MRIGIYRGMPWLAGGAFQMEITLMDALADIAPTASDELICCVSSNEHFRGLVSTGKTNYGGIQIKFLGEENFQQADPQIYLNQPAPQVQDLNTNVIYIDRGAANNFRSNGIDWVLQLQPNPIGFSSLMPFVMPILDLQHRIQPEFPEVSANGQIMYRDYLYNNASRYAVLLIAESQAGKEDILNYYGQYIDEDRIRVLPLFPPARKNRPASDGDVQRVRAKYNLPERFFFYPAQFWKHKNHAAIIEALRMIEQQTGHKLPVVFCGTYADAMRARTFLDVMELAERSGLRERVHYLGFVPDDDIPALYRMAVALVMPTFFGPSNIPPLEGWQYGCPVITSDVRGLRDQLGDGARLVDPRSPFQIAQAMLDLWNNEGLRQNLIERGAERLASYSWSEYVAQLSDIVEDASARVREGRYPRYPQS